MRSAAADIVAAYQSGWDRPWQHERLAAQMVNALAIQLAIAHDTVNARPGACLCAGCRSTQHYAEAADLQSRGLDRDAAWRQRIGDAYYVAHQVARAVGWQRPLADLNSIVAERDEWESSSPLRGMLPPRGPLVT
jgi:hypothetical protein